MLQFHTAKVLFAGTVIHGLITLSTHALDTYYWTAGGDGVSLFQEANWNSNSNGTGATIPAINPGATVDADLIIEFGAVGGGGATGELNLGSGSLLMNGGNLVFAGIRGITGGDLTINGGSTTVSGDHITDSDLSASSGATISLAGAITNTPINNSGAQITASALLDSSNANISFGTITLTSSTPFDNSTFNFAGTPSGTLALPSLTTTEVNLSWLSFIYVNGSPALSSGSSRNVSVVSDGSGGSLVTLFAGIIDSDGDLMDDAWEQLHFGNLQRDGGGDFDNDGLSDLGEFENGTIPLDRDTDGDLLTDGTEVNVHGTAPLNSDSDGDSNPDGFEIAKGTDPNDETSRTNQPNIIFILADDLGYGDLGVLYQNNKTGKKHKTPFLDQMAAEGMILDRHYCPAPVCAPSRGSLLTGLHQGHANIRDNQFDKALEDNHNLATTLKSVGYSTNLIGKWGLQGGGGSPAAWPAYPTKRGFDTFFGYVGHGDGHTHYPGHVTVSRGQKNLYDQDEQIQFDINGTNNLNLAFTPDLFTARAKMLIADEVNDGDQQPFFLYLAYDTPHAALQVPTTAYPGENNNNDLDDSALGLAGGVQWLGNPGQLINTATGTLDSYRHPDYTGNGWTEAEERFATLVRRMDDNVGDLRKTLEDLGIADNTLIVFTSDNGPHNESYFNAFNYSPQSFDSYGPFEGQKRDCWEGGIREPSLVCWPNSVPANSVTTLHSQFHDWMPTFCEVAGVTSPARTDGVSLVPTLLDPNTTEQKTPTTYVEYSTGGSTPTWSDFSNHGGTTRTQAQVIFLDGYKGIRNNPSNAGVNFRIYETITDQNEATDLRTTSPYFLDLNERMKDRVLQIRQPDGSASRPWDNAAVPVPTNLPATVNGVAYESFTGLWPWVPEFTDLTPVSSGDLSNGIDLSVLPTSSQDKGLLFSGYLNIPATGTWSFELTSDSGAFLRIHEAMVVDDDYNHDGSAKNGSLILESGLHPFQLYYKNSNGVTPSLELKWSGPGTATEVVPVSSFFIEGTPDPIPVAAPDSASTTATATVAQPVTLSPMSNDLDDGLPQPLVLVSFTQPSHGTVTRSGDDLTYTPILGFYGTDSFTYTISDGANTVVGQITVSTTFEAPDIWLPLNECGGSETFRASGKQAGSLSAGAVRIIGKHGYGIAFDGVDSEFALPGLSELPTGGSARTVMAWIRVPSGEASENQTIFSYGNNANGQRYSFRLNGSGGSNNPGTPNQEVRLEVQGGSIVGTTKVDDGQWHHVAVTSSSFVEFATLYVDGVQESISSSSPEPIITAAGSTAFIGGAGHSSAYTFLGEIDELRIYPRALTAAEISAVYNATQQVPAAWHRRYFGDAPLSNWDADDDGDGYSRLGEYAFGGDPLTPDSVLLSPVCSFDSSTGKISVSFRRRNPATAHNLSYSVETSENLVPPWNTDSTETNTGLLSQRDCLEWASYESDASSLSTSKQFLRIRAELLP